MNPVLEGASTHSDNLRYIRLRIAPTHQQQSLNPQAPVEVITVSCLLEFGGQNEFSLDFSRVMERFMREWARKMAADPSALRSSPS